MDFQEVNVNFQFDIVKTLHIIYNIHFLRLRSVLVCVHEALHHSLTAGVQRRCQDGFMGDVVTASDWVTTVVLDIDGLTYC